jgi:hypothetical protein
MVALADDIELALFGEDLLFDDDLQVTAGGDYALIDGGASVRQALLLRLLTAPGEYAPFPEYGVGIRSWVKKRRSRADLDALRTLIIDQVGRETRIERVVDVVVEAHDEIDNTGIKVLIKAILLGREQSFAFPIFTE